MRFKFTALLLTSCAAVMAQSASAADLPVKAPVLKAAPYAAWNWTGLYVGAYVGVGVSKNRSHDPAFPPNTPSSGDLEHTGYGFTGGGTVGYNHQLNWGILGQKLVIGVEGDIGSFDTGRRVQEWNDPVIYDSKTSWLATARARVGLTDGPNFNYLTGGFAAAHVKDLVRNSTSGVEFTSSKTETGYVIGSGVETMLGGGWSAKTEALYINLDSGDSLPISGSAGNVLQTDRREYYTQRFGLNYQFGAGKNGPLKQTNWSGLYVGGVFGGAVGSVRGRGIDNNAPIPSNTAEIGNHGSGFSAGGQVGWNWMIAPKWVVGVEGDISYLGIDHMSNNLFNEVASTNPAGFIVDTSWIATARARFAYNTGPALLYATGGGAWVNVKDALVGSVSTASSTKTLSGYAVGGGIETVLWGNWSSKTEYLYVDAGKGDAIAINNPGQSAFTVTGDHVFHLFRSGITYRFGNNPLAWRP